MVDMALGFPDQEDALKWVEVAFHVKQRLGDRTQMGLIAGLLGELYSNRGEEKHAIYWHNRSLESFQELGARAGTATVLDHLGIIDIKRGSLKSALERFKRSLSLWEELGDTKQVAFMRMKVSIALTSLGNVESAFPYALAAVTQSDFLSQEITATLVVLLSDHLKILGNERFKVLVRQHAGLRDPKKVLRLLKQLGLKGL
jgi:tetratricopeptide (TPR) repeat protein